VSLAEFLLQDDVSVVSFLQVVTNLVLAQIELSDHVEYERCWLGHQLRLRCRF